MYVGWDGREYEDLEAANMREDPAPKQEQRQEPEYPPIGTHCAACGKAWGEGVEIVQPGSDGPYAGKSICGDCFDKHYPDAYLEPEPDQEQEQTPTGNRYYPALVGLISDACRDWQSWDLSGGDGPEPYAQLQAALQRAMEEVAALSTHDHDWNEAGYCSICGRDGRV